MTGNRGVTYYATEEPFIEEAKRSAASLKRHNDIDATIFSHREVNSNLFDNNVLIEQVPNFYYDRINTFIESPHEHSLHLDTDTTIAGDIEPIFELLERFDIVAAHNETRDTTRPQEKYAETDMCVPEAFPEYQCGVIAYRNTDKVRDVFEEWQRIYETYPDQHDQPAFREALYNSDLHIGTIPPEFNCLTNFPGYVQESVRIFHWAGTDSEEIFIPYLNKTLTHEQIMERINANSPENRVFYRDKLNRLRVRPRAKPSFYAYMLRGIYEYGVLGAIWRKLNSIRDNLFGKE